MRIAEPVSTLVSTGDTLPTMTSRVDPEGARRMMEMLVNLYADRRLAVVREYVSNAVDASRAAGSEDPVEVTTPTVLDPNLVVADRGTGMSLGEVEATFLAFAASSKRHSDDLIGGLGVGAKSAWALSESFLVDTVKDGRRTTVRAASNLEHQVMVAGAPSDLPNGTTVIVPVVVGQDADAWHRVVQEVATAHDPGAVVVDGKPVTSIGGGPEWIGPIACRRIERPDRSVVVVRSGGTLFSSVPEITERVVDETGLTACVVELPIGSFDHTPSRESIIATDRTRAAVDAAVAKFKTAYAELGQRIEALAETDAGAATALRAATLGSVGGRKMLPIPFRFGFPADCQEWTFGARSGRSRWERTGGGRDATFDAVDAGPELSTTLIVSGVPAGRVISRFAKFLAKEHPRVRRVIALSTGESTVPLTVFSDSGALTSQTWQIGAGDVGTHYTFAQWCAALAVGRSQRGSSSGYECVVIRADGTAPTVETLTAADVASLGLPVNYVDGPMPTMPVKHGPVSVTVYLGRRKSGPLLAEVPHAMTRQEWAELRFKDATAQWSRTQVLGAVYASHWASRTQFDIAAAAMNFANCDQPQWELLEQCAQISAAAKDATDAEKAAVTLWHDSPSARALRSHIGSLHAELIRAYPLLRYTLYCNEVGEHHVNYVAFTPPAQAAAAA